MIKDMDVRNYNYEIAKKEFPELCITDWEHISHFRCYMNLSKNELLILQKKAIKKYGSNYHDFSYFLTKVYNDIMSCFWHQIELPPEKMKYRLNTWVGDIPINYEGDFDD